MKKYIKQNSLPYELEPLILGRNSEKMREIQLGIDDFQETNKDFREKPKNPKRVSPCMVQNGESYMCKLCGRGFKSPKAVFGHLRCHYKRKEAVRNEMKEFNVPRKKRSVGRYKIHTNNSSWSVTNVVDDEMLDVVASLLFLANGGHQSLQMAPKFVINSHVSRGVSEEKPGEFRGSKCGLSECEAKPVSYMEFCNNAEIKDGDDTKLNLCSSVPCYESVDDGSTSGIFDLTLVINRCNSDTGPVETIEPQVELSESGMGENCNSKSCGIVTNESIHLTDQQFDVCNSGKSAPTVANTCVYERRKCISSLSFLTHQSLGMGGQSETKGKHKCMVCNRTFASGNALGGHKRAHYKSKVESNIACYKKSVDAIASNGTPPANVTRLENEACSGEILKGREWESLPWIT